MTAFTEDNLQVTFNNVVQARRDGIGHGLTHCMKAVDFIVELHDRYLFIEFKDPDNPKFLSSIAPLPFKTSKTASSMKT